MAPGRVTWNISMQHRDSLIRPGYGFLSVAIRRKCGKPPGPLTRVMQMVIKPPRPQMDLEDCSFGAPEAVWTCIPLLLPLGFADLGTSIARHLSDAGEFAPSLSRNIALDMLPFIVRDSVGEGGSVTEEFNVHANLELIFEPRECIARRVLTGLEEPLLLSV